MHTYDVKYTMAHAMTEMCKLNPLYSDNPRQLREGLKIRARRLHRKIHGYEPNMPCPEAWAGAWLCIMQNDRKDRLSNPPGYKGFACDSAWHSGYTGTINKSLPKLWAVEEAIEHARR